MDKSRFIEGIVSCSSVSCFGGVDSLEIASFAKDRLYDCVTKNQTLTDQQFVLGAVASAGVLCDTCYLSSVGLFHALRLRSAPLSRGSHVSLG